MVGMLPTGALPRLRPRVLCAAVGVCTAVLASACGAKAHHSQGPQLGSGKGAPTLSQVSELLDRHGHAVMDRSTASFVADVDGSAASATFRRQQTAEIAALAPVPLQSWAYAVSAPVTDVAATAAAATRLGAPTLIVHVTLTYALQRVDSLPASHDLWWTFVTRHGHVYLAGDDAMAGIGGASWRGPWDFGPLVVERGTSSIVLGHLPDADALPAIARAVDAAVPVVTRIWGGGWAQQVAVFVPASAAEFAALGGAGTAISDVSAATVFESPNMATGAGSVARVLIDPAALRRLTPVGEQIVLQHELTHIATAASTGPASPRWLIEGFAEYVGNMGSGQPVRVAAAELRRQIDRGSAPKSLPADAAFTGDGGNVAQVYEESWLACRLIAARAGEDQLVRFYQLVGASADTEPQAIAAAMQSVLHESTGAFVTQWRAYLSTQLR